MTPACRRHVRSPCIGGGLAGFEGDGYCNAGHKGPRCELCMNTSQYFSQHDGACVDCPPSQSRSSIAAGIISGLVTLWICIYSEVVRFIAPRFYELASRVFQRVIHRANRLLIRISNFALIPK